MARAAHLPAASDYLRLFQARDVLFLQSCIFVEGYKHLGVLVTYAAPVWQSYMPRRVAEKTDADGLALYGTPGAFRRLQRAFAAYRQRSHTFFEGALRALPLTRDTAQTFLRLASEIFQYYSKTEFFYTDGVYRAARENPAIGASLRGLGPFKLAAREYMNDIQLKSDGYTKKFITCIARQFTVAPELVAQYSPEEVLGFFDGRRVVPATALARARRYVTISSPTGVVHLFGPDAAHVIERFSPSTISRADTVRGICANPGKARGRAWIFHLEGMKIEKVQTRVRAMERGAILVAETTGPEIMEACQKAAAIVTNQGGMLSHAAIVSRELGIPCVVGTENATGIIHEGDFVEVDAEKGVVRVLQRI